MKETILNASHARGESRVAKALGSILPRGLKSLFEERLPLGVGWPHALGSTLLALIPILGISGFLLALNYSPSTQTAWESVRYIEEGVPAGSLIRGIHHWAASAAIVVALIHGVRVFIYAAYKPPRQWTWVIGVFLLLTLFAFGLTGYLLPWDLKAYFGTQVATSIPGSLPIIGPSLQRLFRGSDAIGNLTLTRFYAAHVILLPAVITMLIAAHLVLVRKHGITPPRTDVGQPGAMGKPFFPYQAWRDSVVVFVVVGVVVFLAQTLGASLEFKADPTNSTYVPRPDWYFLGLQHLLRIFSGPWQILGTAIIPGAVVTIALALPWLDRSKARRISQRPIVAAVGFALALGAVGLTWAGYRSIGIEEARLIEIAQTPGVAPAVPPRVPSVLAAVSDDGPLEEAAERGAQLYKELRCATCHDAGREEVMPGLPPDLTFAGNRYRREWLSDYLRDPAPIRWQTENRRPKLRMPDFRLDVEESDGLAAYLVGRVDNERFSPESNLKAVAAADPEEGRRLIGEYNCRGCHVLAGEGNRIGPDLTRVGLRLRPEYLNSFLRDPSAVIPGTSMKDIDLWEEEAAAIAKYLSTLRE